MNVLGRNKSLLPFPFRFLLKVLPAFIIRSQYCNNFLQTTMSFYPLDLYIEGRKGGALL